MPTNSRPSGGMPTGQRRTAPAGGGNAGVRRRPRKRSIIWRARKFFLMLLVLAIFGVTGVVYVVWTSTPLPASTPPLLETSYICASDVVIPEDGAPPTCTADNSIGQFAAKGIDRETVTFDHIPQVLIDAVVSAEDKDFFTHKGVDPQGVARAFLENFKDDNVTQGGSTITQQYVKNTYLSQERTFDRKIKEAIIAIKLEKEIPKKEILERYLNTIYFGRGAYGVAAASRVYFGKDLEQIGLPESAYLAGLIRAPESADANRPASDPLAPSNRQEATTRRRSVLDRMIRDHKITQAEHDRVDNMGWEYVLARQQAKNFGEVRHAELGADYWLEFVRQWLVSEGNFTDQEVFGGGLRVYTTIDWNMQAAAYSAIAGQLNQPDDPAASIVAIDRDGHVRAMVGGFDWSKSQVNLATGALGGGSGRQPGSSFKPFALATALSRGIPLGKTYNAPGTMQLKIPGDPKPWKVSNYGDGGLGTLDLVEMTKLSSNTAYAQLALDVGPSEIIKTAKAMGVTGDLPNVPSVVLGTGSVSVLDMATGYSTFQNEGVKVGPIVVTKVTDAHGNQLWPGPNGFERHQVLDRNVANNANWIMSQVVQGGTGTRAQFSQPAAGKTGTTEAYRDAWFNGFTCHYVAAVWVGYPGPETRYMQGVHGINVAGGTIPTQIWHDFMVKIDSGSPKCSPWPAPTYSPIYAPVQDTAPVEASSTAPAGTGLASSTSSSKPASSSSTSSSLPASSTSSSAPASSTTSTPASSSTTKKP